MAEGLTLAAIPVRIRRDTWSQLESLFMGKRVRLFDNSQFSSERDEKKVWQGDAYFITKAEEDALRAACPRGATVTANGQLVGSVAVGVRVDFGASAYRFIEDDGELHRTCPLHIEEI